MNQPETRHMHGTLAQLSSQSIIAKLKFFENIEVTLASKLKLRPAGSDPRVGDRLA